MSESLKKFLNNQEEAVGAAKAIFDEEQKTAVDPVKEFAVNAAFSAANMRAQANTAAFPGTEELLRQIKQFEKYLREGDK